MGVSVFWGMLIATIIGVCLIPVLFVAVEKLIGGDKHGGTPAPSAASAHGAGGH
jgi:hypothetical protein